MELQPPTEEAMVKVAAAHLGERFPAIGTPRIEAAVRRSVGECYTRARVKNFVGIIAERSTRAELLQVSENAS